jgi:hypothetical protein
MVRGDELADLQDRGRVAHLTHLVQTDLGERVTLREVATTAERRRVDQLHADRRVIETGAAVAALAGDTGLLP